MSTDKTLLQSIPLRVRVLGGALLLSVVLALIGGSKTPFQTGIWIFIALLLLGFVGLVALGLFWPGGKRKEKKTSEQPAPTAAPAAAGAGAHGHDGHDHGASHGHGDHHGQGPVGTALTFSLVVLILVGTIVGVGLMLRAWGPPATVVRHPPATSDKLRLADPPATTLARRPRYPDNACQHRPRDAEVLTAPVEGCSKTYAVPDKHYVCTDPGVSTGMLRQKNWYGQNEPEGWSGEVGDKTCLGTPPQADGTPAKGPQTGYFWTEPYVYE